MDAKTNQRGKTTGSFGSLETDGGLIDEEDSKPSPRIQVIRSFKKSQQPVKFHPVGHV
jgi:hypothetical protein